VTAFPTWQILVDGQPAAVQTVAPGFPSVRVAAGKHHIEATTAPLPGYLTGIVLALVGGVLCSLPSRKSRDRARAS
jgi:uncharacterized membrane protein YfhO